MFSFFSPATENQTTLLRPQRPDSGIWATLESLEPRQFLSVAPNAYTQINLVTSGNVVGITARVTDPNLINPWGLAINPTNRALWISDNGMGLSTAYMPDGTTTGPIVTIPLPTGSLATNAAPTGMVINTTNGFLVSKNNVQAKSLFIYATEDGTISGWSPTVDSTHAILKVDNSANNAVYKGLALAKAGRTTQLYAADFHNAKIDVFDNEFHSVVLPPAAFHDGNIPATFAPFNVQNIGGNLFVTYAKQNTQKHDDVAGAGNGFVDIYSPQGKLLRRLVKNGHLNSPWAVVKAPAKFGHFSGDILIGNFGDGRINAYDPLTGKFAGTLKDALGTPITIDGLWGLQFGSQRTNSGNRILFFASGPNHEAGGLVGRLTASA